MKTIYKINAELDIPIYQQLVDAICVAIKNGTLSSGAQLLTVSEMVEQVGVARGTVKRAYDELERIGLIEKIQGRGTFVKYQPSNSGSRKERAMASIDRMLDELEGMGLSANEINIFLDLKIRERSMEEAHIKVAVVECNPENLSQMSKQLRHIDGVDIYSYTFDSIKQYPYKLSEDFDLIVTTVPHSEYLEEVVPYKKRIARVALRPSAHCLSSIIKLRQNGKIGVIGYSQRFSELIHRTAQIYAEDVYLSDPIIAGSGAEMVKYLKGKDVVLVPKGYQKYFDSETSEIIRNFKGDIIECDYKMDEGSVLYLETKIRKIVNDKNS
jgi:DNA-binding transcriptional regulator YhcF (GntR family)